MPFIIHPEQTNQYKEECHQALEKLKARLSTLDDAIGEVFTISGNLDRVYEWSDRASQILSSTLPPIWVGTMHGLLTDMTKEVFPEQRGEETLKITFCRADEIDLLPGLVCADSFFTTYFIDGEEWRLGLSTEVTLAHQELIENKELVLADVKTIERFAAELTLAVAKNLSLTAELETLTTISRIEREGSNHAVPN